MTTVTKGNGGNLVDIYAAPRSSQGNTHSSSRQPSLEGVLMRPGQTCDVDPDPP